MPPTVRVIKKLNDTERQRVLDILSAAYQNEVVILSVLGGDKALIRPCLAAVTALAEAAGGVHVVGLTEHKIDAVALWFPPGEQFIPTPESGWMDVAAKVATDAPDVVEWWGPLFATQNGIVSALYGEQAEKESWFLWSIGVDPSLQRRGLGSQLIQYAIAEANKARSMIIVEGGKPGAEFYIQNGLVQVAQVAAQSPRGTAWEQVILVYTP